MENPKRVGGYMGTSAETKLWTAGTIPWAAEARLESEDAEEITRDTGAVKAVASVEPGKS